MKVNANKIQWVLGLAILAQVGCNTGNRNGGQRLMPNVSTQAQEHSSTGDNFRRDATASTPGLANLINNIARGAQNTTPGVQMTEAERAKAEAEARAKAEADAKAKGGPDATPEDLEGFTVDMTQANMWKESCIAVLNRKEETLAAANTSYKKTVYTKRLVESLPDRGDNDGIPDDCEVALSDVVLAGDDYMGGLNKDVYNGAVVAAKRFVDEKEGIFNLKKAPTDTYASIRLTKDEKDAFKEDDRNRGGQGKGVFSKYERQLAKKYQAVKILEGTDLQALRHIFKITQIDKSGKKIANDNRLRVHNNYKATDRSKLFDVVANKEFYALVKGGDREAIPHSLSGLDVGSASELSGLGKDTDLLRERDQLLYGAETHLYVPAGGLEIRIGHLNKVDSEGKRQAVSGTSQDGGLFIVLVNGESEIVQTDLINDHTLDFKGSAGGPVTRTAGCETTHLVIGYLAGTRDQAANRDRAIFAENVFYREEAGEDWKPLRQDMMSLQPIPAKDNDPGEDCAFTADKAFFEDVKDILATPSNQRVTGPALPAPPAGSTVNNNGGNTTPAGSRS